MSNIGRIIYDDFCNGFADREYDMYGAVIVAEGESWIVAKKRNGIYLFLDFQIFDWNRNPDGSLSGGISNLSIRKDMQEYIDDWCTVNPHHILWKFENLWK
jgi:hypothetical protein